MNYIFTVCYSILYFYFQVYRYHPSYQGPHFMQSSPNRLRAQLFVAFCLDKWPTYVIFQHSSASWPRNAYLWAQVLYDPLPWPSRLILLCVQIHRVHTLLFRSIDYPTHAIYLHKQAPILRVRPPASPVHSEGPERHVNGKVLGGYSSSKRSGENAHSQCHSVFSQLPSKSNIVDMEFSTSDTFSRELVIPGV